MCIKLEVLHVKPLGCWVGDHIETSFRDWFATQVATHVNSLSKDGPASSQVAAVMESQLCKVVSPVKCEGNSDPPKVTSLDPLFPNGGIGR